MSCFPALFLRQLSGRVITDPGSQYAHHYAKGNTRKDIG
jgi:hypothetical protein